MTTKTLLLFCFAAALPALAQPITTCGSTLTAPGNYYLTGNLNCTVGPGIRIASDNVTINLGGFTLSGSGSASGVGIYDNAATSGAVHKYLVVSNGRITNWKMGFQQLGPIGGAAQLSRAQLTGLRIDNNASTGVYLSNVIGALITGSTIENNTGLAGVYVEQGALNSVASSTIRYNRHGVWFASGSEQNAFGNTVLNNVERGIWVQTSGAHTVRQNQAFGNPVWDLADDAIACGTDIWTDNSWGTRSKTCIH